MRISLVILGLFISNAVLSQLHPAFLIGANHSMLKTESFETSGRTGFQAGFSFHGFYNEKFQTISEFYFETSGASTTARATEFGILLDGSQPLNIYRSHSSFSLIANYFVLGDYLGVQFGPHVKILNFGRPEVTDYDLIGEGDDVDNLINQQYVYDAINKVDFGLSFGLSAGYSDFMFSARYNLGLRSFSPDSFGVPEFSIKNNSLSFGLTYIIKSVEITI